MNASATGMIFTCSGANHVGNTHFVSSIIYAKNLQIAHKIALCNTIGVFFSQSLSVYFRLNLAGKQKSSWQVESVYSFQIAGFTFTSNFGP